ncbi:MAG: hypothetical protein B6I26_05815 [Desulfobacteraceae bacterium 4572_130]|nr:MAG: hypothetical protein B6I26_05815 [Desulfobacteraceae bacterium 4572_130]
MPKTRIAITPDVSGEILFISDRTCCVCRERGKRVQIHHIDEDPSNNFPGNLSVLCLECHDETKIRGGFGKHLTAPVVKKYRDEWLLRVQQRRDEADRFAISKMAGAELMLTPTESEIPPRSSLYTYLDSIPEVKKALGVKAQPEWDSGVTARMNQASYDYIDGIQGVLVGLSKFYTKEAFDNQEPHEFFSEIISSRFRWHRSHLEPNGPGSGGTIVGTMCGGSVMSDVESMVEDMVSSLTGYSDEYSWKHWKRRWDNKAT